MINNKIRLSKSSLGIHEQLEVIKALDSEYLGYGSVAKQFEDQLNSFLGTSACVVNSGTSALILALQVANVSFEDIVIVPSLTYLATAQAITALGAIPFFCDVDLNGHLSLDNISEELSHKAKAIITVHYAGVEMEMTEVLKWARKNDIRVIEDAAHSFGSTQYSSSLSKRDFDLVCYSFDGIKNITTAEGGCICAKSSEDQIRLQDIRLLGVKGDSSNRHLNTRTWEPNVTEQGWRAHLSNVNAAIGLAQLNRSSEMWSRRRKIGISYFNKLINLSDQLRPIIPINEGIIPHIYPIIIYNLDLLDNICISFRENFIEYGRHYYPCHKLDYFSKYNKTSLSNTNYIFDHSISLPMHCDLTDKDIDNILNILTREFR